MAYLGAGGALLLTLLAAAGLSAGAECGLGAELDSINAALAEPRPLPGEGLDSLFGAAVDLALSDRLGMEVESLRDEAFGSGDWAALDSLQSRAAPAIAIRSLGESVLIGVDAAAFLAAAEPGTPSYEFFDLATDGFYAGDPSFPRPASAGLPVWMERSGSSAQASPDPVAAREWLAIWNRLQPELSGRKAEVGRATVAGLSRLLEQSPR